MDLQGLYREVIEYVNRADLRALPGWQPGEPFKVAPLAQGEYNLNYCLLQGERRWVVRVNMGTQIQRDDQISYEYRALQLLQGTGVTPIPYYLDASRQRLPYGLLIMAYLPGEALDYRRDLSAAARLFARIHTHAVDPDQNHLIREDRPLSMMFEECSRLLGVYFECEFADAGIRDYLTTVLACADEVRLQEIYFLQDPWHCIINTEVNSRNFIANRETGSLHLVDWEKPLWGDPSQDLSHFCVPTTTLWKTDYRMSKSARNAFLNAYRKAIPDAHYGDTLLERVRLRDLFNCLRGISWSAMAWVRYQSEDHALRNADTFRKIETYLQPDFLKSLFDPYLKILV